MGAAPILALGALAIVVALLVWLIARDRARDRDLTYLAALLDASDKSPVARARLESDDAAVRSLAQAVDRRLDGELGQNRSRAQAEARFRQGLAALSHDIRTPLAGAQGYFQLARKTSDPARHERFLDGAEERLRVMRSLVDDLYAYAATADPSLSLELAPLKLAPLLLDALAGHYADFIARGWEPDVEVADEGALVLANEDALVRVMGNLVANSLVHGSGAPTLRLEGTTLIMESPVSPDQAAHLDVARVFDDFYQADAARSQGGSGLGLSTVARLCEAMGATVEARLDDVASGPVFSVTLTLRPAPAPAPA